MEIGSGENCRNQQESRSHATKITGIESVASTFAMPLIIRDTVGIIQFTSKDVQCAADGEVDAATAGLLHGFEVGQ